MTGKGRWLLVRFCAAAFFLCVTAGGTSLSDRDKSMGTELFISTVLALFHEHPMEPGLIAKMLNVEWRADSQGGGVPASAAPLYFIARPAAHPYLSCARLATYRVAGSRGIRLILDLSKPLPLLQAELDRRFGKKGIRRERSRDPHGVAPPLPVEYKFDQDMNTGMTFYYEPVKENEVRAVSIDYGAPSKF
jgi:hypothetical protein